jgi:hypothetical protein
MPRLERKSRAKLTLTLTGIGENPAAMTIDFGQKRAELSSYVDHIALRARDMPQAPGDMARRDASLIAFRSWRQEPLAERTFPQIEAMA